MDADFVAKQGDAGPLFTDVITDLDGNEVDLTGCELEFVMQAIDEYVPLALTGTTTSPAPTTGAIQYQPTAQDTGKPGSFMANWQVTTPLTAFTADVAEGSASLTAVSSYAELAPGVAISGDGIPVDTYVLVTDGETYVTLTNEATANGTGVTLTPGNQQTYPINGYLWVDIDPNIASAENRRDPTHSVLSTAELVRPSVSQLASLCRARTTTLASGGQELGQFTSATRPTYEEANDLIDQAVTHVMSAVGPDIPDWTYSQIRQLVLLYAARLVEVTFYALSVSKGDSSYEAYGELYTEALEAVNKVIEADLGGAPHQAVYSVPVMSMRQARVKELVRAAFEGTFRYLPDDMRWPMGPKGLPYAIPGNSAEWDAFDWGGLWADFSAWMEVDW